MDCPGSSPKCPAESGTIITSIQPLQVLGLQNGIMGQVRKLCSMIKLSQGWERALDRSHQQTIGALRTHYITVTREALAKNGFTRALPVVRKSTYLYYY